MARTIEIHENTARAILDALGSAAFRMRRVCEGESGIPGTTYTGNPWTCRCGAGLDFRQWHKLRKRLAKRWGIQLHELEVVTVQPQPLGPPAGKRICSECKRALPVALFVRPPEDTREGLDIWCHECRGITCDE